MSKPLLLDTFCKAGGTSMGYHMAGFEVVGVDIELQKRYPFEFHQSDAIEFILKYGKDFDVIAASPPCQPYTPLKALTGKVYLRLIQTAREAIKKVGKPYVIENVKGARFELDNPIMLCGAMFGLKVDRKRYFETIPRIWFPPQLGHQRGRCAPRGEYDRGQYGLITVAGNNFCPKFASVAMGIDWMIRDELSQAIPPAYTEWIGKELRKLLNI